MPEAIDCADPPYGEDSAELIGVLGAGTMGSGLAQNLAETGHRTIVVDISSSALIAAEQAVRQGLRLRALLGKGGSDPKQVMARITFAMDYDKLTGCDAVIENVPEKWTVKRAAYAELERVCRPNCLFIANTSCMPIERIAAATQRKAQVIGVHFMNPVPLKETVELMVGPTTGAETLRRTEALLARLGKRAVRVADAPGFVSNRVLMPMINDAIALLDRGAAPAAEIDLIFTACFGHKMGPLATADLIGLDTVLDSLEVLRESLDDPRYDASPLLRRMVAQGHWGRKRGRGFFIYDG
jgi:3-hydroxybutyryl-CoA dehydrogenase